MGTALQSWNSGPAAQLGIRSLAWSFSVHSTAHARMVKLYQIYCKLQYKEATDRASWMQTQWISKLGTRPRCQTSLRRHLHPSQDIQILLGILLCPRHFSFRTKGALRGQYVAALEIGSNGEKLCSNDCHGACRMGFSHPSSVEGAANFAAFLRCLPSRISCFELPATVRAARCNVPKLAVVIHVRSQSS